MQYTRLAAIFNRGLGLNNAASHGLLNMTMENLNATSRIVFIHRYLYQRSKREIALEMGINIKTGIYYLQQALKILYEQKKITDSISTFRSFLRLVS